MLKVEWLWIINYWVLFTFSTLTEALERSKRKYQSRMKKMEEKLFQIGLKDDDNNIAKWNQQLSENRKIFWIFWWLLTFDNFESFCHFFWWNYLSNYLKKSFVINMNGMSLKSKQFEDIKTTNQVACFPWYLTFNIKFYLFLSEYYLK